jgi:hypothetical protein
MPNLVEREAEATTTVTHPRILRGARHFVVAVVVDVEVALAILAASSIRKPVDTLATTRARAGQLAARVGLLPPEEPVPPEVTRFTVERAVEVAVRPLPAEYRVPTVAQVELAVAAVVVVDRAASLAAAVTEATAVPAK